ncbi:MAG: LytTR family transcriptional regulator [Caulobacterales bacterium]|nr:LytTR family transcriptional regulator [Caulobacterales bacterium]
MPDPATSPWLRRSAADLALFAAIGVVMAFLGPFGTSAAVGLGQRLAYWIACMVGGGVAGVAVDEGVLRLTRRFWPRLLAVSVAMTPPVTGIISAINYGFYGHLPALAVLPQFVFQVFVVSFAAMTLRQLAWAQSPAAPLPAGAAEPAADPLAAFRQRLSAKRRAARLFAVEAEDHYLRVHTEAGDELITARFGDALRELAAAPGFQVHRSWWVAAEAIDEVRWRKGRGEARLKCGLTVPVSRSNAAALKAAGWF